MPAYLAAAERWCATLDEHFWVADAGGYAFTADDTPDVIVRMRGAHDDATPNANAVMISNLVALQPADRQAAPTSSAPHAIPQAFAADLGKQPARPLRPARRLLRPHRPAARGGDRDRRRRCSPPSSPAPCSSCRCPAPCSRSSSRGPAARQPAPSPARPPVDGKPTAYACLGPQCSLPVTDADALLDLLADSSGRRLSRNHGRAAASARSLNSDTCRSARRVTCLCSPFAIEILRRQPLLVRPLQRRPFAVDDGEPGRVAVAALVDRPPAGTGPRTGSPAAAPPPATAH